MTDFLQMEYLMDFLMGLTENFSQARAQILLMDPLPSIRRAFSLLLQEEQQRSIGSFSSTTPAMAFAVASSTSKNNSINRPRKDRLVCTHCNIPGHIVDKCYKIHGYKTKQQQQRPNNSINFVSTQNNEDTSQGIIQLNQMLNTTNTSEALIQCQNLLNQLQPQINTSNQTATSHIAGTTYSSSLWIIDSRASTHISCYKTLFTSI